MTNVIPLTKSSTSTEPLPRTWIEKLFDKMLLSYGKKFTDQWIGADPGKLITHWAEELASFTGDELKRGYAALDARDWPPTLPEFKRMCRPPVDSTVAYYEAVNGLQARERGDKGEWSHPAIFWASASMAHDLRSQGYTQIKDRWEKALREQMEKGQWAPIPEVMQALPAPGQTKLSRADADKMVQELNAAAVNAANRSDHRAWIGKVLERAKAKDSTLPSISVQFAREAMKVSAA